VEVGVVVEEVDSNPIQIAELVVVEGEVEVEVCRLAPQAQGHPNLDSDWSQPMHKAFQGIPKSTRIHKMRENVSV
jgi:hypothetical protein